MGSECSLTPHLLPSLVGDGSSEGQVSGLGSDPVAASASRPRFLHRASASWCLAHLFQPVGLLHWAPPSPNMSFPSQKQNPMNRPDSKATISSLMLNLEEAGPQGGRIPPPTLSVSLIYYRSSLVKPKCSEECLPSGGHTAHRRISKLQQTFPHQDSTGWGRGLLGIPYPGSPRRECIWSRLGRH